MESRGKFDFILACPTLGARGLIYRMMNSVVTRRPHVNLIDDRVVPSVAEKWNAALERALERDVPIVIANDDIVLYPDTIDAMLDAVEKDNLVTGITVDRVPGSGDPEQIASGGFSLFALSPDFVRELERSETERWGEFGLWGGGFSPGRFDEGFGPAYFEDNDYYRRAMLAGLRETVVEGATYYHELTGTSSGGSCVGCSTHLADTERWNRHNHVLRTNRAKFEGKWGGIPGEEVFDVPWNGARLA